MCPVFLFMLMLLLPLIPTFNALIHTFESQSNPVDAQGCYLISALVIMELCINANTDHFHSNLLWHIVNMQRIVQLFTAFYKSLKSSRFKPLRDTSSLVGGRSGTQERNNRDTIKIKNRNFNYLER